MSDDSFFKGIATCIHGVFMGPCAKCGTPYPKTWENPENNKKKEEKKS